ncbi:MULTISPECIES: DUF1491 family protein [Sphingobium]|jgi:hypothetical protein|uniref:DUF1491 family protein n=2 Tax=Sphingobium fuliginis (strain ATCC 27551) TaxID=336203 RepID=A0A7M2GEV5_SPHSA|nr:MULTISPECIES: DUF1491 family protein [Sphingobium]AJR23146.1 hypothetical protein TZ53_04555 [Sphingobium sp. YBL2]PNP99645.1 hypothetical protein A8G00_19170 [Sphingobium sp. SA916]QOT71143.1 DUF1491 family protein [Sphingobium fuliginis]WDA34633.1 DUF1491 family protein [Sphingobium sp. YC-XJ3]GGA04592.1 hypothetical protein GCM10019071_39090 [Sphingobium fuliginis]
MPADPSDARLTSAMLVGVLMRRCAAAGGFATVLVKGDAVSGVILLQALENGREQGLFERVPDYAGGYRLTRCGPDPEKGAEAMAQYLARRRGSDPDLWVIELDIADAERFAAETIC